MIDVTREQVISLTQAAKRLGVTVVTVRKWVSKRMRGRQLETAKAGGKRITTLEALQRFCEQDQQSSAAQSIAAATNADLKANHERAMQQLRELHGAR